MLLPLATLMLPGAQFVWVQLWEGEQAQQCLPLIVIADDLHFFKHFQVKWVWHSKGCRVAILKEIKRK